VKEKAHERTELASERLPSFFPWKILWIKNRWAKKVVSLLLSLNNVNCGKRVVTKTISLDFFGTLTSVKMSKQFQRCNLRKISGCSGLPYWPGLVTLWRIKKSSGELFGSKKRKVRERAELSIFQKEPTSELFFKSSACWDLRALSSIVILFRNKYFSGWLQKKCFNVFNWCLLLLRFVTSVDNLKKLLLDSLRNGTLVTFSHLILKTSTFFNSTKDC